MLLCFINSINLIFTWFGSLQFNALFSFFTLQRFFTLILFIKLTRAYEVYKFIFKLCSLELAIYFSLIFVIVLFQ